MNFSIALDLFPLAASLLAALACALVGNFLVLRRASLMGDAISHSVLPGLVIAFLATSSRSPFWMIVGAAASGLLTVVLVELVTKLGRVERGAAMGVAFSVLFALGVLLIEQAAARQVDLDADCVLHGQLETLVWYGAPDSLSSLLQLSTLEAIPRQVWLLLGVLVGLAACVTLLFKEFRIAAFDPELATSQGFSATGLHYLLMALVAFATVAAFEAVGSILVIAMLIAPAATARLFTDRLGRQIEVSLIVAIVTTLLGYFGATSVPAAFDYDSVNAAGSMTVAAGIVLCASIGFAPRYGILARRLRQRSLRKQVAVDDLLAALYRIGEQDSKPVPIEQLRHLGPDRIVRPAILSALRRRLLRRRGNAIELTTVGRDLGLDLVRRHRLWETYLVERAGLPADHVHDSAEQLEHLEVRPALERAVDPHGKPIPDPRTKKS